MIIVENKQDSQPADTVASTSSTTPDISNSVSRIASKKSPSESQTQDPPPYEPRSPPAPVALISSRRPTSSSRPRVNFLYISEPNQAIKGVWKVDPNLRIPEPLLPPVPEGQTRDNLRLVSRTESVRATIILADVGDNPSKSLLHAESQNGKVKVEIESNGKHRFYLTAKSQNESVTVRIPRDFHGPITFTTSQNGSVVFSDAVHAVFMLFNQVGKMGKGFIGNWDTSSYPQIAEGGDTKETWSGDELILESQNGKIKIFYNDEPIPPREKDLLKKDLTQHGPVAALAKSVRRNILKGMGYEADQDGTPGSSKPL